MSTLVVRGPGSVSGSIVLPGDKSISHRALMLGAVAAGRTTVRGIASGQDVASTIACLAQYGVRIEVEGGLTSIYSRGIDGWVDPDGVLDCGNSGTTMRTLAGLAARRTFASAFDGDDSLRRRPMERVAVPLRALGARVDTRDGCPPLWVRGGELRGTVIDIPVPSAQVKTAVMLAGLGADGTTTVTERVATRDHTERLLQALGVDIVRTEDGGHRIALEPASIPPFDLAVPGDVSSSAFIVAAAVLGGNVHVEGVGLNRTRIGYLDVLDRMGALIRWETLEERMNEPVGTIDAEHAPGLHGVTIDGASVPPILDELPVLAVVATQAAGETIVRDAGELRVKESDRIDTLLTGLRALGADVSELDDGFVVRGPTVLNGATVASAGDHRIGMAFAVAGLIARGVTRVEDFGSVDISWPGFDGVLSALGADVELL